jgi:hypothetical protein
VEKNNINSRGGEKSREGQFHIQTKAKISFQRPFEKMNE